jgi:hypothetical protein
VCPVCVAPMLLLLQWCEFKSGARVTCANSRYTLNKSGLSRPHTMVFLSPQKNRLRQRKRPPPAHLEGTRGGLAAALKLSFNGEQLRLQSSTGS